MCPVTKSGLFSATSSASDTNFLAEIGSLKRLLSTMNIILIIPERALEQNPGEYYANLLKDYESTMRNYLEGRVTGQCRITSEEDKHNFRSCIQHYCRANLDMARGLHQTALYNPSQMQDYFPDFIANGANLDVSSRPATSQR